KATPTRYALRVDADTQESVVELLYLVHKSLAASHVAASYWTAASDVAATSAPVNAVGQRRSTPPATSQRLRITVVIGGQRWRSTTVVGGEPPLTAAGPPLTTTGPPVNGGWWAGQRLDLGRSGSGLGRVRFGSRSGPGRVCHMACHVSATCAHVASTWMLAWIICNEWESTLGRIVGIKRLHDDLKVTAAQRLRLLKDED
nr:hypothetical protein [Tanacetum cinerariifolium]